MNPEIGFNTHKTKEYIINKIKEANYDSKLINLEIIEIHDSLIITLSTKKSKILGFRADIDALEIKEQNNFYYKSKNDYMHACGHDAHTAILLYLIIDLLNHPRDLNGTIRCIFQSAEEGPGNGGAYYIFNHPLIKEIDYFYALHVNSELDRNSLYFKNDYIMSSSNTFKIELYGKSCHITRSSEGVDVLKIGLLIYNEINNIKINNSLIYVGTLYSGKAPNIVPDYLIMEGSIRTFDIKDLEIIKKYIYDILEKYSINNNFSIKYNNGYPSIKNDLETTNLLIDSCRKLKCNIYILDKPFYLSDDFARYKEHSKICYFFLGTKKNIGIPLHSSTFDLDEESLILGYQVYKKIISEYFGDYF